MTLVGIESENETHLRDARSSSRESASGAVTAKLDTSFDSRSIMSTGFAKVLWVVLGGGPGGGGGRCLLAAAFGTVGVGVGASSSSSSFGGRESSSTNSLNESIRWRDNLTGRD